MDAVRWDDPDTFDDVLLLAAADDGHRRAIKQRLAQVRGRLRHAELGAYPRFKILTASSGPESLRRAPGATLAAVNLALPNGPGLEAIRQMRESQSRLAILA